MTTYRLKPPTVEAWRFMWPLDPPKSPLWLSMAMNRGDAWFSGGRDAYFTIKTETGEARVNIGDWIVFDGRLLRACDHDSFVTTYEPAP